MLLAAVLFYISMSGYGFKEINHTTKRRNISAHSRTQTKSRRIQYAHGGKKKAFFSLPFSVSKKLLLEKYL